MHAPTIRSAVPADVERIKTIAVAAEMFTADDVEFFDGMLGGFFDGSMEGHHWLVAESDGTVIAAANYAPEPFSDRLWNLYFIAVHPAAQGGGLGGSLMEHAETDLQAMGEGRARVLLVETSSTDQYARTREFYAKLGYDEEARIRDFYGPGDDKVTFWKSMSN